MTRTSNLLLIAGCMALFLLELGTGSVTIPLSALKTALINPQAVTDGIATILWESRIPRAIAAALGGAALAWSGMLMQTMFRNPLAGPSMLGITSGAGLGVALLAMGGSSWLISSGWGSISLALAACIGAFTTLMLVLLVARRITDRPTLLVFGIMLSFFTSAVVDALQSSASNEALRRYVNWGLGSFGQTGHLENAMLLGGLLAGLGLTKYILPRLNLLLLGEAYAATMGVSVNSTHRIMMIATGILAGVTTAFCGPVAFIGLAVPHISRRICKTADHKTNLLPTLLLGANLALACDLVSRLTSLPLNTITAALGAPFVIALMLNRGSFKAAL